MPSVEKSIASTISSTLEVLGVCEILRGNSFEQLPIQEGRKWSSLAHLRYEVTIDEMFKGKGYLAYFIDEIIYCEKWFNTEALSTTKEEYKHTILEGLSQ